MPNLDGGHYFFTAIVPIRENEIVEQGGVRSSPVHMVRDALETLPTALQSHAAEKIGIQSPFARSDRTHFARFVVLDQPFYNGRNHTDALVSAIRGTDLTQEQPHDLLACPYLLVMIDFDPSDASDVARDYCEGLWRLMAEELTAVFRFCHGFEEMMDEAGFADFLLPCQIETTMPFNDYWIGSPALPSLSKTALIAAPAASALLPVAAAAAGMIDWVEALALAVALLIVGLAFDYYLIMRRGGRPLPAAPNATLRHVLKALYLQQEFTRFVMAQQDRGLAEQGAAFRAFLALHAPADLSCPTQPAGVIRSPIKVQA